MSNTNWNNLGDQFRRTVQDAIRTGDFRALNDLVSDTVTDVVSGAGNQVGKAAGKVSDGIRNNTKTNFTSHVRRTVAPITKTKNVGQLSSMIYTAVGIVGMAANGILLLVNLMFSFEPSPYKLVLLIMLAAFIWLTYKGVSQKKRLSRMKRYISLFDDNMYANINELADQTQNTYQYVLKDVKKMLELGFFPEGHLDKKETCLMLDDATYREYLQVEQERERLAKEEAMKKATRPDHVNEELQTMIREGNEYILKLHDLNDQIPGEVISKKLDLMECTLREIFQRLEEDPSQMSNMHKLMNYYLPTTIKLLEAYRDFDNVITPNEEIDSAKAEIEKTVDTINEAFKELLNKLFQPTVYDVTADAQVLQTMLAKEGLTKNKFAEETK